MSKSLGEINDRNNIGEVLDDTKMNETEQTVLSVYSQSQFSNKNSLRSFEVELMRNPDGTLMMDHNNRTVSVEKILATKPLKSELSTRPGPGNRKLTYMSGDSVTRTLNEIFGFDGWCLEIKNTKREVSDNYLPFRIILTYSNDYKLILGLCTTHDWFQIK